MASTTAELKLYIKTVATLLLFLNYAHSKQNEQNLLLAELVLQFDLVVLLLLLVTLSVSNSEDDGYIYLFIFLLFSWSVSRQLVLSCLH